MSEEDKQELKYGKSYRNIRKMTLQKKSFCCCVWKKKFPCLAILWSKNVNLTILITQLRYNKLRDNGMAKEGCTCICLSVMLIDSVLKLDRNYYKYYCKCL